MRRAFVLSFLVAALPIAACVPALPESMLSGSGGGPPPGSAGVTGGAGSAAAGGLGGHAAVAGAAAGAGGAGGADAGAPPPFVVLVDSAGVPDNLAVDEQFVYWVDHHLNTVMKIPIEGGGQAPLTPLPAAPNPCVAIVGDSLFVGSSFGASGDIFRVTPAGGPAMLFARDSAPINHFTASAAGVFWTTNDGSVMTVGLSGGTPRSLAEGQDHPDAITVDAASVYWVTGEGTVMKTGLSGGTPVTLAAWPPPDPAAPSVPYLGLPTVAVNATTVFWGQLNGPVRKVGLTGGESALAFIFGSARKAASITADTKGVYYGDVFGSVHLFLSASPDFEWIIGDGGGAVRYLATDATSIYWVVGDRILKAPR
jgi:hypothetical protein